MLLPVEPSPYNQYILSAVYPEKKKIGFIKTNINILLSLSLQPDGVNL